MGWHIYHRVFQTLPPSQRLLAPGRSLEVITLQGGVLRVGVKQGCISLSLLLLLLTRDKVTAASVLFKPHLDLSHSGALQPCSAIDGGRSRQPPHSHSQCLHTDFLSAARSPATTAEPG